MIVNCPKCGFSQPKDRYCANCGVDTEAYRPKEVPLSSRVMKNWMFQAAVLIVAIATGLSFLRVQHERDLEDFSDLARPLPQQTTLEAPPPPPPPPPPIEEVQPQAQAVVTPPPLSAQPLPVALATRGALPPTAANRLRAVPTRAANARAGGSNSESVFTQIDLVYAEVPATVVGNLVAGSRMIEADAVSAGVYPNIAPLMRQLATAGAQRVRGLRVLESARNLSVQINQPIITFKGTRDSGIDRNLGLTSQIIPTGMDENGLHFQIEVQRTLRQPGTTGVQEFSYQAEITLTKGAGAFIYGLIPRGLDARERGSYANAGVLKIMASPDFQDSFSEFVLFIEAR